MSFLMPKVPAISFPEVQEVAPAPKYDDADREAELREKRRAVAANRKGRQSTILTSAQGLEDDASVVSKKTLLGG